MALRYFWITQRRGGPVMKVLKFFLIGRVALYQLIWKRHGYAEYPPFIFQKTNGGP